MKGRAAAVVLSIGGVGLGAVFTTSTPGGLAPVAAQAPARAGAGLSLDPVRPGPGVTARDYLRGFTDAELAAARKALPERPEPPLGRPVPRQVNVTGQVFADANRNGRADGGEPGLADVMVSDGERVTRTGRDGKFSFSLPMPAEIHNRFVFANRPTGYAPTNAFFLRIPFDEARTEYVAAFGFVEDANARRDTFSFLTTSDTQFSELEWMIPTAKDYAQMTGGPEPPAFLVTAGDLTDGGWQYHWDMYDVIRGASKVPVYDGFGGHDGSLPGANDTTVNYEARIGPPYYSWDYGGVHFIQLITELNYLRPEASKRHHAWLAADLKALRPNTPVIAISHYPLPAEWFDQRKAEGVRMIGQIGGHYHIVMAGSRAGVPVMNSAPVRPDWGAYGRTYRRVFVSPQGLTSDVRIAGQYQRLEAVAPGSAAALGAQPLVVLAYDSVDTVEKVAARITSPKGATQKIDLTRQGGWSWHGRFAPEDPGQWRVELQATDTTGKVWQRTQSITVGNARLAAPEPTTDFPWILAGDPPRRVKQGPEGALYPLWVTPTGSVHVRHASPVVSGGRLYVAITNPNAGNPGSGVLCLDARTGKELWRAASPMGDIPGSVAVHNGRVYALTGQSWVAAFDAATGKAVWQTPLKEEYRQGRPLSINYTSPVPTERGLLVSESNNAPVLLNYDTGRILQLEGRKAVDRYAPHVTAHGGVVYAGLRLFRYARSLASWETLWESEDEIRHTSPALLADGKLFYTGCCRLSNLKQPPRVPGSGPIRPPVGTVDPFRTNLVRAIDAASGKIVWETALRNPGTNFMDSSHSTPAAWDDLLVVNGAEPMGLDAATGKERWSLKYAQDPERYERSQRQLLGGSSGPIVAGSRAFFGHDDTSLRAVDKSGRVVWEYRLGTAVNTSPTVSGNLLFVHDYVGNLWAFAPGRRAE
jgi:outer membrane protein assembly factor BamB